MRAASGSNGTHFGARLWAHGYRVICEADETAEADALCDAYLASATKL